MQSLKRSRHTYVPRAKKTLITSEKNAIYRKTAGAGKKHFIRTKEGIKGHERTDKSVHFEGIYTRTKYFVYGV